MVRAGGHPTPSVDIGTDGEFEKVLGCQVKNADFNQTSLVTECLKRLGNFRLRLMKLSKGSGCHISTQTPFPLPKTLSDTPKSIKTNAMEGSRKQIA